MQPLPQVGRPAASRAGLRKKGDPCLDRISVDNAELLSYLRLVRRRLHELIQGGGLVQPHDVELLIAMIDKVEDEHGSPFR